MEDEDQSDEMQVSTTAAANEYLLCKIKEVDNQEDEGNFILI